jgi:transposase
MKKKYPDEFKQEAVRKVLEKGFSVLSVAKRLGISDKSLYYWVNKAKNRPSNLLRMRKYASSKLI